MGKPVSFIFIAPFGATVNASLALRWAFKEGHDVKSFKR